jgi:hypothetical protein
MKSISPWNSQRSRRHDWLTKFSASGRFCSASQPHELSFRAEAGYLSPWAAFGSGNEYYIGARHAMGSSKISLHQSGICRIALTEKHFAALPAEGLTQPSDRVMVKWKRQPTPEIGAAHVASIIFPTEFLKLREPQGTRAVDGCPLWCAFRTQVGRYGTSEICQ